MLTAARDDTVALTTPSDCIPIAEENDIDDIVALPTDNVVRFRLWNVGVATDPNLVEASFWIACLTLFQSLSLIVKMIDISTPDTENTLQYFRTGEKLSSRSFSVPLRSAP